MWSIIYFHPHQPIHLESIKKSNPNNQVISIKIEDDREKNWFNGDRLLIKHLKNIFNQIEHENILLLEWDVLINIEIKNVNFKNAFAKNIYKLPERNSPRWNNWWWKTEVDKLPKYLQNYARGIFPFCIIGIKKQVLKRLFDPRWEEIFNDNIFCEVRLPTILNYIDCPFQPWPMELKSIVKDGIEFEEINKILQENPETKAIIHPVKMEIKT